MKTKKNGTTRETRTLDGAEVELLSTAILAILDAEYISTAKLYAQVANNVLAEALGALDLVETDVHVTFR